MKRIKYGLQMFWLAFKKPAAFQYGMMKLVVTMMDFLAETARAGRPMRSEISMKCLGRIAWEEKTVLFLWCGVPECDNPLSRCIELAKENTGLKAKLNSIVSAQVSDTTKD